MIGLERQRYCVKGMQVVLVRGIRWQISKGEKCGLVPEP